MSNPRIKSLKAFVNLIEQSRSTSEVLKCKKTRCELLTKCVEVKEHGNGVIYWMQRDCRVQDNWALIFAQRLAQKAHVPLYICVFGAISPFHLADRQHKFFLKGLSEVQNELKLLNISFVALDASASAENLFNIIKTNNLSGLVCEFFPLKQHKKIVEKLTEMIPEDVPIIQVDAHNIVPCILASPKLEIGARTIRPKINGKLDEFLHSFPVVKEHEFPSKISLDFESLKVLDLNKATEKETESSVIKPGYNAAVETLFKFITNKLKDYGSKRNDPSEELQSELSPYLHSGQISAQRVALEVKSFDKQYKESVANFLEELIVRRELSDNFCHYNENYDNILGANKWAQETLKLHNSDKRAYIYDEEAFTSGKTHDDIWNAAQNQLLTTGRMHGYLRMYWAKKVLEWTPSAEEALRIALKLNDTYALDGCDPNGFVGVMWSICGVHDQGWGERPIFGKIRFMVDYSLRKKFDVDPYIQKYGNGFAVSATNPKKRKIDGVKPKATKRKQKKK